MSPLEDSAAANSAAGGVSSPSDKAEADAGEAARSRPRRLRGCLRTAGCLALTLPIVMLLIAFAVVLGWQTIAASRYAAQRDAARARGEPTEFSELARPDLPLEVNAQPWLQLAALQFELESYERLVADSILSGYLLETMRRDDAISHWRAAGNAGADTYDYGQEARAVAAHYPQMLIDQALARPSCRYSIDYEADYPLYETEVRYALLGDLGRVIFCRAVVAAIDGDAEQGLADVRALFRLAEFLIDAPLQTQREHRLRMLARAMVAIEVLAGSCELSAAQQRGFDELLTEVDPLFGLRETFLGERCALMRTYDSLRQGRPASPFEANRLEQRFEAWSRYSRVIPWMHEQRFAFEILSAWAEFADQDVSQVLTAQPELQDRIRNTWFVSYSPTYTYQRASVLWKWSHVTQQKARNLRLGLRVEAWRRRHGALPSSLEAVLDERLTELPTDAFSQLPLRLEQVGGGFMIYGPGENRLYEGGRFAPWLEDWERASSCWVSHYDLAESLKRDLTEPAPLNDPLQEEADFSAVQD